MNLRRIAFIASILVALAPSCMNQPQPPKIFYPAPTGLFPVGTKIYKWQQPVESKKHKIFTGQIWYPAARGNEKTQAMTLGPEVIAIIDDDIKREIVEITEEIESTKKKLDSAKNLDKKKLTYELTELDKELEETKHIQEKILKTLGRTYSHAQENAPLLDYPKPFPVIIFSHGFETHRNHYLILCENLASHGYVVFAVDHPNACSSSTYPKIADEDIAGKFERVAGGVEDIGFVLSQISLFSKTNEIFQNKLDLTKIGMLGHSYGGVATTYSCGRYPLIKAGIALDSPIPKDQLGGFAKPFMIMLVGGYNEVFKDYDPTVRPNHLCSVIAQKQNPAYMIKIPGATHNDFSDLPVFSKIVSSAPDVEFTPETGTLSTTRMTRIVNNYIVSFFNQHLADIESPLLQIDTSPYEEATLKKYLPASVKLRRALKHN